MKSIQLNVTEEQFKLIMESLSKNEESLSFLEKHPVGKSFERAFGETLNEFKSDMKAKVENIKILTGQLLSDRRDSLTKASASDTAPND